jgi:hypothetical protein
MAIVLVPGEVVVVDPRTDGENLAISHQPHQYDVSLHHHTLPVIGVAEPIQVVNSLIRLAPVFLLRVEQVRQLRLLR